MASLPASMMCWSLNRRYEETLRFFTNIFEKHRVKTILDYSCGTGHHVIRFSQVGFEVIGSARFNHELSEDIIVVETKTEI